MRSRMLAAAAVALVLTVVAVFGEAVRYGFSDVDDPKYVTDNTEVRQGLSAEGVRWAFTSMDAANWHPLTWLSHMADVSVFGLEPAGHHAVSVILHALATVLVFFTLYRVTSNFAPSLLAAALFGVHPLRAESVVWIAERKDVLSLVLAMAALLAYDRHLRQPHPARFAAVAALVACGLAAKPMLVTLPLVFLLLDFWPYGRVRGVRTLVGLLREKWMLIALSLASCLLTLLAQSRGRAVESLAALPAGTRFGNAAESVVIYVAQSLWPAHLSWFYPHPGYVSPERLAWPWVTGAVGLIAAITWGAFAQRNMRPHLLFGWLWFLITLVPVLGLVQVGEQAHADRYTYLPMIGLLVAVLWGLMEIVDRHGRKGLRVATIAGLAAVAAAGWRARSQVHVWSDPRALHRQALAHTERNYVAHNNLGVLLAKDGRWDEARSHFEEAVSIVPAYAQAQDNLGNVLMQEGRIADAIERFETAARASADPEIRNNLGNALIAGGREEEGMRRLEEAIRARPDYALAHYNLAMAAGRLGQSDKALTHFDLAIRYRPDRAAPWANRGLLLLTLGRREEAARDLRRALALQPDWAEVRRTLEGLDR